MSGTVYSLKNTLLHYRNQGYYAEIPLSACSSVVLLSAKRNLRTAECGIFDSCCCVRAVETQNQLLNQHGFTTQLSHIISLEQR